MKVKKYKWQSFVNDRWVVWYMETPKDRSKLGVWKIVDAYSPAKKVKFAFRWKVKGNEKTQSQLDNEILNNAIRNFYKGTYRMGGNARPRFRKAPVKN